MIRKAVTLVVLLLLSLPAAGGAQESERERERREAEREREAERREREREREAERREREAERRAEERERERERLARERERHERGTRLDTTLAFSSDGVVELRMTTGLISVRGWDRPQVRINASVERGMVDAELSSRRVSLDTRSSRGHGEGRFELMVPHGTRVVARATSADIEIHDARGPVEATSTSGDVMVEGATGRIVIESLSGDVLGRGITGNVSASAMSGDVELERVTGDVVANTVSGDVTLMRMTSRDVRVETVSGEAEYWGSFDANGRYEFHSHSGNILVAIPEGTGASLQLETYSGVVETDFPLTLQPSALTAGNRHSRRRIETTLGNGGARIVAETFSGNISLEKTIR